VNVIAQRVIIAVQNAGTNIHMRGIVSSVVGKSMKPHPIMNMAPKLDSDPFATYTSRIRKVNNTSVLGHQLYKKRGSEMVTEIDALEITQVRGFFGVYIAKVEKIKILDLSHDEYTVVEKPPKEHDQLAIPQ
jgi:hypothetical protein